MTSDPYFSGKYALTRRGASLSAQLVSPLRRRILSHDRAPLGTAGLLKGAEGAQRARIIDGADNESPGPRGTEVPAHSFERVAQLAVAVDVDDRTMFERRTGLLHPDQHAGKPHFRKAARTIERDEHDLIDLGVPLPFGPPSEVTPADETGFVVVGTEIRGA